MRPSRVPRGRTLPRKATLVSRFFAFHLLSLWPRSFGAVTDFQAEVIKFLRFIHAAFEHRVSPFADFQIKRDIRIILFPFARVVDPALALIRKNPPPFTWFVTQEIQHARAFFQETERTAGHDLEKRWRIDGNAVRVHSGLA